MVYYSLYRDQNLQNYETCPCEFIQLLSLLHNIYYVLEPIEISTNDTSLPIPKPKIIITYSVLLCIDYVIILVYTCESNLT